MNISFECNSLPAGKARLIGWFNPNDDDCFLPLDSDNPWPDLYPGQGWVRAYIFIEEKGQ